MMHPKLSITSSWLSKLACLLCLIPTIYALTNNQTDYLALLEFKSNINQDPSGALETWNETLHFCQWHGVTCGHKHQRVSELSLRSLQLSGSISPFIGNLSFLRKLDVMNNSFQGEIPSQIGQLRRLEVIELGNNSLVGEIPPNMSSCLKLVTVILYNNKLQGRIPEELGSLSNVETLVLANNNLTGSIPPTLGNMSSLQGLYLYQNNLDGSLPVSFDKLFNLRILSLATNRLSGTIPSSIFNLSSLTTLDVAGNNFHGTLPSNLGFSLPNAQFLSFDRNQFSGSIPFSISNASNLQIFQLAYNSFSGKVPPLDKLVNLVSLGFTDNQLGTGQVGDLNFFSSLTNATFLRHIDINLNNFGGSIPKEVGNLSTSTLSDLFLNNNQITGGIPTEIGNLLNLETLDARNNMLSGSIPYEIGNLVRLKGLWLDGNNFSGCIPSSMGNLVELLDLSLTGNKFGCNIPFNLSNCQRLLYLDLSANNLNGTIPPEVIGLSSLSIGLYLSGNQLEGSLPLEVGNLKNLGILDVSNNSLSGQIPSSIGECLSLEKVDMSDNLFQGSIPPSLGLLKALRALDLSSNNLSGKIPDSLLGLKILELLDLSYNNLEGTVPIEGVFANASEISVVGNPKLCGGIPELKLPRCKFSEPKKGLSLKVKLAILAGCLIPTLTILIACFFIYQSRRKKKRSDVHTSNEYDGWKMPKLSYQTLLKATNGFSPENFIGSGSFGSVYKGTLDPEGMVVAVKVLDLTNSRASKSFIAECESLKNIRHHNLIKVVTACSSVDHQGNDFKALVYEYMGNGSLEEWLHPSHLVHGTPRFLKIVQRLNICIDAAYALEYLHHQSGNTIVHCDLKPSNVLLDDEMVAHVSDFGLSKLLQEEGQSQTSQSFSTGIRGTIGYAPPEYAMGGRASIYGDIYSYGILLLESFTGLRPTDAMFKDGLTLRNFVQLALPDQVAQVVDQSIPEIRNEENKETMANVMECLVSIFRVGISCSMETPCDRIYIDDVISQLSSVRDKLLNMRL